ncbi:MAG: phosphate ABC transporter substrate-binding protein PstS [Gemmataceae bacterium]
MPVRLTPILPLLAVVGCSGGPARIDAGGSSFVDPIVQKWAAVFRTFDGVEIDYVKKGSGYGIAQMTARTLDFGCTDAPMTADETARAQTENGDVLHVPITMGAVAVIYHLPELGDAPLRLSGPVLADIFARTVTRWDDPSIAALNPGAALPDKEITPVFRAESSGTTNIFTEYLSKVSPGFKKQIGVSKKPKWPSGGIGQEGSDGVTGHVQKNPYCIGYTEVLFAKKNHVRTALVQNRAGRFTPPEAAHVTAAATAAVGQPPAGPPYSLHELTYSLTDAPGDSAYPIAGLSYAVLYVKQPKAKGAAIAGFLKWAVTDGQRYAADLEYAPLPADLQAKAAKRLDAVVLE